MPPRSSTGCSAPRFGRPRETPHERGAAARGRASARARRGVLKGDPVLGRRGDGGVGGGDALLPAGRRKADPPGAGAGDRAGGPGGAGFAHEADALRRLHELKTGRLIAASVRIPLVLADVGEPETIKYRRFADELGVLFQIVDDILDVTGSEEALGKPRGSDERHGKLTYVSLFGLDRARELAAASHAKAREALAETTGETDDLRR